MNAAALVILRDQLSLQSWIAIGSVVQSVLFLALGRIAFLPGVVYLACHAIDSLLMIYGKKTNIYMAGVNIGRTSGQFPSAIAPGDKKPHPSSENITVLLIGTRSNHPLGALAPGFQEQGKYMTAMQAKLATPEGRRDYGFLGSSFWTGGERSTSNDLMFVCYFKTPQGVHAFADGPLHREARNFYEGNRKTHPHLAVWHELYDVPAGSWENIFVNSKPMLFSATKFEMPTSEGEGKSEFVSGNISADQYRVLASSKGRLGWK